MKKIVLMTIGVLSLGLGLLGIFLPLLPTTPFLLLASACFLRSSETLHRWLTEHPVFGSYISNYEKYKAISIRTKIVILTILWISITCSSLVVPVVWIRYVLVIIASCISIFIMRVRTLTPEMLENSNCNDSHS